MDAERVCSLVSILIVGLLIATKTHVDAKSCCPSTTARNIYNTCRLAGFSRERCASISGCKLVDGTCPDGWNKLYCMMGCASSKCATISKSPNKNGTEVSEEAETCNNTCFEICEGRSNVDVY